MNYNSELENSGLEKIHIERCSPTFKFHIQRISSLETFSLEKISYIFGSPIAHRSWQNPDFICMIENLNFIFLVSARIVEIIDPSSWLKVSIHSKFLTQNQLLYDQLSRICAFLAINLVHDS